MWREKGVERGEGEWEWERGGEGEGDNVFMDVWVYMCIHEETKQKGFQVSSSIILHHIALGESFSLNWKLSISVSLVDQQDLRIHLSLPSMLGLLAVVSPNVGSENWTPLQEDCGLLNTEPCLQL